MKGALFAGRRGTVLPRIISYGLGYAIRNRALVTVAWLAALVPLYISWVTLALIVASLTNCPPNAYECPV